MTKAKEPGFYLKFSICDENDRDIVHQDAIRILTAREFYDQRFIPANVASTYEAFAKFMGMASTYANLLDALTTFSRSNYTTPVTTQARHATAGIVRDIAAYVQTLVAQEVQIAADADAIAEVSEALE